MIATPPPPAPRLTVVVNGESQLEYHRDRELAPSQQVFLDRLDAQMDGGIELNGAWLAQPDALQRAQFVALRLITAIRGSDEQLAAAATAYLATRIPELRQLRATDAAGECGIDFVFDRDYRPEAPVQFFKPDQLPH